MSVHGWSPALRTALMVAPVFLAIECFGPAITAARAQDRVERHAANQPIVRSGQVGQPIKLNIDAPDTKKVRFVRIVGLPAGFRLSRGFSVRDGAIWYVSATDVATVTLIPTPDFSGVARLSVDFVMIDETGDKSGRPKSQVYVLSIGEETAALPTAATALSPPPAAPEPDLAKTPERERRVQPYQEEDAALSRAQELIKRGDISSARLLYEDLALSGSALGALALARTYDPDFLRSVGAFGMRPDLDLARKWYSKASELGNGEASRRLSELR